MPHRCSPLLGSPGLQAKSEKEKEREAKEAKEAAERSKRQAEEEERKLREEEDRCAPLPRTLPASCCMGCMGLCCCFIFRAQG